MPITLNGSDGNAMTSRDVDGSASNFIYASGLLGFSGNYPAGGDTVDFTSINDKIASGECVQFSAWSTNGNLLFQYVPLGSGATALNAWKLKISGSGTFGTELAAGAYPAGVTGDKVAWAATFRKLLIS